MFSSSKSWVICCFAFVPLKSSTSGTYRNTILMDNWWNENYSRGFWKGSRIWSSRNLFLHQDDNAMSESIRYNYFVLEPIPNLQLFKDLQGKLRKDWCYVFWLQIDAFDLYGTGMKGSSYYFFTFLLTYSNCTWVSLWCLQMCLQWVSIRFTLPSFSLIPLPLT
jgi:hypothetical protein